MFTALFSLLSLFWTAEATLTIDVANTTTRGGTIRVAVFRDNQRFLEDKPYLVRVIKDDVRSVSLPLEPGWYAIAIFHDQNNNGQLDKKLFGIPKEPYGFSNNFRPVMSAPKFSDCRLQVERGEKRISIKLI
ncbi:DUF2141 domain-containing protein [Tellurirhabdus rosea]|uniref:DUF2141 domain-containing protein n=1 Tax=Tellurirhabdus rosea TaxID=2674997 RepID=UPI00224D6344|nr:DUF2141 domain-containing protein [Tellurirhabdus rosea]